jgi:ATP-dependent protease ClpP protease subunit
MLHKVQLIDEFGVDIKKKDKHLKKLDDMSCKLLEENSKKNFAFWDKSMRKDFFITSEEALQFGLVDEII